VSSEFDRASLEIFLLLVILNNNQFEKNINRIFVNLKPWLEKAALLEKKLWKNSLGYFFSPGDKKFNYTQLNMVFLTCGEFFSHIEGSIFTSHSG